MGLLSYALLLFSLTGIGGSTVTIHAMNNLLPSLSLTLNSSKKPTPTPTGSPTSTPTATPTPAPTPIRTSTTTQSPKATPIPQVQPTPSGVMFPIQTMETGTPATATPASAPVSATPTAVTATVGKTMTTKTTLTNHQQQNAENGDKGINIFMLPLSIGTPLLLVSGGMLWLLWRRQMSQYKPAPLGASRTGQTSLWVSRPDMDSDLNTLHSITGASGALPIPATSQTSYMPMPTPQLPFPEQAYTPSRLHSITTALPQQMFTMSLNEAASYPQDDDLLPWSIDSLNLPPQLTEARESNNSGQMPPLVAHLMVSTDIPTLSTPLPSLVAPVVSLAIQPPSIKNDPLLGEVMRQAQAGLFVVLGREKSLTNLHPNY